MSQIWVISDHHFFHRNIIKYCDRPFGDEYEMNEYMIKKWNEVVEPDDLVIHCGDFFAGLKRRKDEAYELKSRLKGRVVLIRGNHDHFSDAEYKKMGFIYVDYFYLWGRYLFAHYPLIENKEFPNEQIEILKEVYLWNDCDKVFHGHQHGTKWPDYDSHFNVGVDRNNFTPINLLDKVNELGWK